MRYRCTITHDRLEGTRYSFGYRTRLWLTDLDAPDNRSRVARLLRAVHPADHLGDPRQSLRDNVDHFLRLNDVTLTGGRVLMLSQARGLGYAFDPLTVYWCHNRAGQLVCVILEIRNTYGDRHCHIVRPDARGRAEFGKELYVSPFFPLDGEYSCQVHLDEHTVHVRLTLKRNGRVALVAGLTGMREPDSAWRGTVATLGNPVAARLTTARIHYQAWLLRRRGLPLRRRRTHPPQPGVQPPDGGRRGFRLQTKR